ncbi:MAG: phage tail protein [Alkalilacustris sp.]
MADDFALPVAFHFAVSLDGAQVKAPDAAFRAVSGLEAEIETEEVREGGENAFVHRLPRGRRQGNLSLVRGLAVGDDPLLNWCRAVLEGWLATEIATATVLVKLLDASHQPIAVWSAQNCWPVKWQVAGFDAMKNEVAVETIELCYTTIKRVR